MKQKKLNQAQKKSDEIVLLPMHCEGVGGNVKRLQKGPLFLLMPSLTLKRIYMINMDIDINAKHVLFWMLLVLGEYTVETRHTINNTINGRGSITWQKPTSQHGYLGTRFNLLQWNIISERSKLETGHIFHQRYISEERRHKRDKVMKYILTHNMWSSRQQSEGVIWKDSSNVTD